MADYWKSQAKKFCEFCKCWIADNKPSVDFHEKGKRHKDNVAQRLKQISRQSFKDHKEKMKIEADMKKMEKAALKAYLKDVEANADYTSQVLNQQLKAERSKGEGSCSVDDEGNEPEKPKESKPATEVAKEWYEAVSDEGYTYYWNSQSGESVWEPPSVGYVSLDEQKEKEKKEKESQARKKEREEAKRKEEEKRRKQEEAQAMAEEQRAALAREKMKSRAVKDEPETPRTFFGPAPRGNPYGKWTTVKTKEVKQVDLQLPEQKQQIVFKAPEPTPPLEPVVKFKEKSVSNLQVEGNDISFKKRKLSSGSKANRRQRTDDE